MTIKSRNDLFKVNGSIVGSLVDHCAKICPKALILIVTNPVNALVPFAAEVLKKQNTFDARRLFGVTTLDVVRAETFLAEMLGTVSELGTGLEVDVIGGHSTETVVPLFSQVEMPKKLSNEQVNELICREWTVVASFSAEQGKEKLTLAPAERHPKRRLRRILRQGEEIGSHFIHCLCCLPVSLPRISSMDRAC